MSLNMFKSNHSSLAMIIGFCLRLEVPLGFGTVGQHGLRPPFVHMAEIFRTHGLDPSHGTASLLLPQKVLKRQSVLSSCRLEQLCKPLFH